MSTETPSRASWRRTAYVVAVVGLLAVGAGLRLHHLESFPRHGQTADEYAWTWAGMTLWTKGVPSAWSWLDAYPNVPWTTWRGMPFRIVTPWLDHPPVFALVQGAWMVARGYRNIFDVDLRVMREMSVLLYALTFFLLWRLARTLVGRGGALFALLIYATATPVVFNGRLVVSENLITPLTLGAHLSLVRWYAAPRRRWLAILGACCFLLPLTKLPAVCLCFALVAIAWSRRRWAPVWTICTGTAMGVCGVVIYGVAIGGRFFFRVLASHADRFTGFAGFYAFIFSPRVVDTVVIYLPFLLAFILAAHALLSEQGRDNSREAALPIVVYPLAMTFLVAQGVLGWYQLPLYPYYAILLGAFSFSFLRDRREFAWWILLAFLMPGLADRTVQYGLLEMKQMRFIVAAITLSMLLWTRLPGVWGKRVPTAAAVTLLTGQVLSDVADIWLR